MSRRLSFWLNFIGAVSLLALLAVVWFVPKAQVSSLPSPTDRIQAEIAARDVLVKAIGGLLVFVTAFVSVRNLRVSEDKQIAERFSKAVEMLGHEESIHIRLGGIYALERIARDSQKDRDPVLQVLAAFVRTKTSGARQQKSDIQKQRLHRREEFSSAKDYYESEKEERNEYEPTYCEEDLAGEYEYFIGTLNENYIPNSLFDVQAAVSAIGRQNSGAYLLDLSKTLLEGITFEGNYEGVSFHETHFKDCVFGNLSKEKSTSCRGDDFRDATFEKVVFKHSDIRKAHFDNSVLISITLENSDFREASLAKAKFSGGTKICKCQFNETTWTDSVIGGRVVWTESNTENQTAKSSRWAYFTDRSEVRDTDMTNADFEGAEIINILFKEGSYEGTSFENVILSGVTFDNTNMGNSDFTKAQIGYESKFHIGHGQYISWKEYQSNYSDEVVFKKAGVKKIDMERGGAVVIKAIFS